MIYYGINTLFNLKLPPRSLLDNNDLHTIFNSSYTVNSSLTLCMDGFQNGLEAIVSFNRDWLEGTELKFRYQNTNLKNEFILGCSGFFSNLISCHRSLYFGVGMKSILR